MQKHKQKYQSQIIFVGPLHAKRQRKTAAATNCYCKSSAAKEPMVQHLLVEQLPLQEMELLIIPAAASASRNDGKGSNEGTIVAVAVAAAHTTGVANAAAPPKDAAAPKDAENGSRVLRRR